MTKTQYFLYEKYDVSLNLIKIKKEAKILKIQYKNDDLRNLKNLKL